MMWPLLSQADNLLPGANDDRRPAVGKKKARKRKLVAFPTTGAAIDGVLAGGISRSAG